MFHQNSFLIPRIPRIPSFVFCALIIAVTGFDEAASVGEAENTEESDNRTPSVLKITASQNIDGIEAGSTPSFVCKLSVPGYVWWSIDGRNLTTIGDSEFGGRLDIKKANRNDTGNYKCMGQTTDGELLEKEVHIRVVEPARIEPDTHVRVKVMETANLTCHIHGYPLSEFSWSKVNDRERADHLAEQTSVLLVNETYSILTLQFKSLTRKDNGTYTCKVNDYFGVVTAHRYLFVLDVPKVSIDFMKAVGAGSIFLNWTVDDGNEPVKQYFINHVKNGTDQYQYYRGQIGEGNSSYVLKGFESGTAYQIGISAMNAVGTSHVRFDPRWITTLDKDPVFIPEVSVNGVGDNSITIRWTVPPSHLSEHVHYYNLMAMYGDQKREAVYPAQPITDYVFIDLEPATTYEFKVAACSEYTRQCGNWSAVVNGTTIDGVASPPRNLSVTCRFNNITSSSYVFVTWSHPEKLNGVITRYNIQLTGRARYKNDMGRLDEDSWNPPSWGVCKNSTRYDQIPANTNYTVRVHGVTRSRTPGKDAVGNCTTPVTVPDKDSLNVRSWRKIENQGRQLFKLYLPRISERNGPICCYRIFLVKLAPQKSVSDLPPPEQIGVYSYQYVHGSLNGGAYVAEAFESEKLISEIFLGDGVSSNENSSLCNRCIGLRPGIPTSLHFVPEIVAIANSSTSSSSSSPTTSISTDVAAETTKRVATSTITNSLATSTSKLERTMTLATPTMTAAQPAMVPMMTPTISTRAPTTATLSAAATATATATTATTTTTTTMTTTTMMATRRVTTTVPPVTAPTITATTTTTTKTVPTMMTTVFRSPSSMTMMTTRTAAMSALTTTSTSVTMKNNIDNGDNGNAENDDDNGSDGDGGDAGADTAGADNTDVIIMRRKRTNNEEKSAPIEGSASILYPQDGFLDEKFNYTGFVEIVVFGNHEDQYLTSYSGYFNPLYAGQDAQGITAEDVSTLAVILQISTVFILMVIVLLVAIGILHRYTKRARQRGEEVITLRNSFRHLCRSLRGRHQLVAASLPDFPPIAKADLLQAYLDRHRDSDYGFQYEFELLPDRFTDRTTRASGARGNLYKNRYPDIKCYDQTRVRLSQINGIYGSDYINANFVLGYKERKKFICAQGPMDNTVCDYWRLIWEQHLELILMLTNLEEYSKTKCTKYWPDKAEADCFGDIIVEHVSERPYSDYIVRELKMSKVGERGTRRIVQYHFLVWKDFMAPEHPHAILRFIKRVNEAYSLEKGPILVHCSAGVGRTGTLVALDSLLQQLAEEGQVSIFNTVCDLRHQRNFLVQSLKQYIFIYRALMEMAQYGDTEIPILQLKNTVVKLRQRDNGKEKCRMEEEYDKISSVLEDRKSFSVGGGEENRTKNRSELIIPYDRNRVILTPVPGREHSTYINASFVEGYDNSESFVITQDPMEVTIADFWRMISEQSISTIVMLSDLSEGPRKCPRYWPDDEAMYDHVRVRYIHSESCPYYTRRELCVANTKTNESLVVTQYQYHGWPTVEGEVPEVTRGLIELVDQTLATGNTELNGPLVVHCSYGSDRSSMFVALSILVQQLRIEKRVDIFTTTKKLRSQRHGMISTFAQYEFLHRAIVNYADLHNLADDEIAS